MRISRFVRAHYCTPLELVLLSGYGYFIRTRLYLKISPSKDEIQQQNPKNKNINISSDKVDMMLSKASI